AENVNALSQGLEDDAVWATFHLNGLDGLERLGIPHHDGAAAAEAVLGLGIDGDTPRPGVRDGTHRVKGIQVKGQDLTAPRNIEPAIIVVCIDIIDPAAAHGLGGLEDLVGFSGWSRLSKT